jgi:leucyl-tRNA synthetase
MDNKKNYDYVTIEKKWQKKWFDEKINVPTKKQKKKFFIHFAYPGVSGYLHVGHMRGFTYCDIITRYKKMMGFDALYPAGFHASGIPSVGFAKKVERKDKETISLLKKNGCSEEIIKKLIDPKEVVKYFSGVYVNEYWKKFGFFIDYSRLMNTISRGYNKFIEWQFYKLHEEKLLIQKPHFAPFCPNCGPVAVDKSETDISRGGSSEILDFTIIKFKLKDRTILPAATLRPETIFGVTNMWVNPNIEYEKVKVNNEVWICSKECIEKITYQFDNVEILFEKVPGKELIGKTCIIPEVNREIPILAGVFADPSIATGIVMSVPAHAPYDWIALVESKKDIPAIKIIDVKGFGENPAKEACNQLNITSQTETKKLDEATEIVYKKEFHTGILNDKCGNYSGLKITEIKDAVKNDLISKGLAATMKEFSEEVICRCKEKVVIKQIPDQWFIKYSDELLTQNSKKYAETMNIYPPEYKEDIPKILDWFDDRAAIRKGSWLGTPFPFKKDWIIEPISDSTLYPAYYIISKYVNEDKITAEEMTKEFFDYIFLGIGKAKEKIWDEIKSDFDYWYPVDINLGGKEHKTVHFPVYLMNHVAIMPEEERPKGIFVHWWVTQKGKEKISKSKGGAEPIVEAAITYGVDAMRLYYAHVGSPFVDVEWDEEIVTKYKNKIANIWKLIQQLMEIDGLDNKNLDNWLKSTINRRIQKIHVAFNDLNLRIAANEIFYELQNDIQWYLNRGGGNKKLLERFINTWIKLMTPFTPHIAEELWHINHENLVSIDNFPKVKSEEISEKDEIGEYLLSEVTDDVKEILKVTKIQPKKIHIYVSPSWKEQIFRKALELDQENKLNIGLIMKEVMTDSFMKTIAKDVSQYVGKLPGEIKKMNVADRNRYLVQLNGVDYLNSAKDFLKKIFSCGIEIYSGDKKDIYDPANKARFAIPLRPAIYIE